MRSFLLAATWGAAESLSVDVTHKSKKPAVQALMESATKMLKNGATPAVVNFTETTLAEVAATVLPSIIEESENDQAFIYGLHSRFQVIRDSLANSNQEVHQLNAEEQVLSSTHKECRDLENSHCSNKRNCEMELYRLWTSWVLQEEELQEIHGNIDGHFCPPGTNGTLDAFRVTSTVYMEAYMAKKEQVDEAEHHYDVHVPQCTEMHTALDHQSSDCNNHQTLLEEKACQHANKITEVLTMYYADHAQALSAYNCAQEEVMQLENDRKREWTTLQVVNCLLERIRDQNGVPCDDASGGVTAEVGICEERHGSNPCVSEEGGDPRLCLTYPDPLLHPAPCAARDAVVGECLPVVQNVPCSARWHQEEYGGLPEPPQAPFSEENPGCNAYPECAACNELPTPGPSTIDSCPGYTQDGCATSNAEEGEHPLTFVRDVNGVADVRCCSVDGATCESKDFQGGIDFVTPGGSTDHGCYFQVPYQEAMSVCHAAGMRLCTTDEVQACCGTGCWHDHNSVWVDVAPGNRD